MLKKLLTFCGILSFLYAKSQTVTFPANDVADNRPSKFAFIGATIYQDYKTVLNNATLIIQNGKVLQVGINLSIPTDAQIIDCKGRFIYPSFIETESDYGMPEVKRGTGTWGNFEMNSKKKGAFAWNPAIQPEMDAMSLFTSNPKQAEELRKTGFGAAITHNHDGIARGSSVLVSLANGKDQNLVLRGKTSAHYSYSKGSSNMSYPSSMMGSVALLRQTYYDAQWYGTGPQKTEFNQSLEAFNQLQSLPQVFETNGKLDLLRADNVGDEFNKQYIISTFGDEYQVINDVKKTNASLIVPINFPGAPDVDDALDSKNIPIIDLKHWEMAPANLSFLQKAGVNFAITSNRLKSKSDFLGNLIKAIDYGLTEEEALKALTSTPATLFKINDLVGDLNVGKLANFIITDAKIFTKNAQINENWIRGERYIINDMNLTDIRGKYDGKIGAENVKVAITGKLATPEVTINWADSLKASTKIQLTNDLISFKYNHPKQKNNEVKVNGYYQNGTIKGTGLSNNELLTIDLKKSEDFKPEIAKVDTAKKTNTIGEILYPFQAFGNKSLPVAENFLIKNATVWTNEKDGILANADVLVENGKIAKVGKNLNAGKTTTIDGTGKHLTTGIIDEHSHIALTSINEGGQSSSAEVRTSDVLDHDDIDLYRQLAGGTTSAQLLHGSANSIGGQSSIIKFKWGQTANGLKITGADPFIKFALGENVTRKSQQGGFNQGNNPRYPISRMGVEQVMIDAFTRAKAYDEAWKAYNSAKVKDANQMPRRDLELEALAEIINKKRFITCHSYVQSEINMMMKVAEQFGFRVNTFTHILEGYKLADIMAKHGAGGSSFSDWWAYKMEVRDAIPHNAAMMSRAGVTTAINSDDAEMARRLNQEAAKTMLYGGLTEEEAWKTVTLNPAKLLHLDNRMGSIKAGKDADLVLWSHNPLSVYARVEKAFIEGATYFDRTKEAEKLAAMEAERERIIKKIAEQKNTGGAMAKPSMPKAKIHSCEDERSGF